MELLKLLELIAGGEDSFTEFKRDISQRSDFASEMIAFSNSEGGQIIVGVDDDGTIVGLANSQEIERTIMDVARHNCNPPLLPGIDVVNTDQGKVIVVNVYKRVGTPHENNSGQCYIRVGSTKRLCSPEERARLFQLAGIIHIDQIPIQNTSLSDFHLESFSKYYKKVFDGELEQADMPLEKMLSNMRFMVKDINNRQCLSLSGLLLFGKAPQDFLYYARISAVRWKGNSPDNEIIDRQEIIGRLPNQIELAQNFLLRNTKLSTRIRDFKQEDKSQYPIVALREAVVNAVAHRDYSLEGAQILLYVFDNRIEIRSPGLLPNSVTLDNIRAHYSKPRNETIARVLFNLGFVNTLGSGVPRIIKQMLEHTGKEPSFELSDSQFVVKLFSA